MDTFVDFSLTGFRLTGFVVVVVLEGALVFTGLEALGALLVDAVVRVPGAVAFFTEAGLLEETGRFAEEDALVVPADLEAGAVLVGELGPLFTAEARTEPVLLVGVVLDIFMGVGAFVPGGGLMVKSDFFTAFDFAGAPEIFTFVIITKIPWPGSQLK